VAALVFSQLAKFTGELSYEEQADELEQLLTSTLMRVPARATQFGMALESRRTPSVEVVVVGRRTSDDTKRLLALVEQHRSGQVVTVLLKDTDDKQERLAKVAPFTKNYSSLGGKATAYVCRNRVCQRPTTDPQVMLDQLKPQPSKASPE
jgi:hypothetical protein